MCYITFKTPTTRNSQLVIEVGRFGSPASSSVPPSRTSFIFCSADQPSVSTLCPKKTESPEPQGTATEHTEQEQAENTQNSQVQVQFFCHFAHDDREFRKQTQT